MTPFMRQAAALFARAGWTLTPPETPAEKHARMCAECHPTAKAIERVRDQWVVAGIDKGE